MADTYTRDERQKETDSNFVSTVSLIYEPFDLGTAKLLRYI